MAPRHAFALFMASLLLAGCSSLAPTAPPPPQSEDAAEAGASGSGRQSVAAAEAARPEPMVESQSGAIGGGAGASANGRTCWAEYSADRVLDARVPEGATAVLFELVWDDDVQDLTLSVSPPGAVNEPCPSQNLYDSDGATGSPDKPARILVEAPAAGLWTAGAQANGLVADISYTVYASVFMEPMPEGFTAVPA